MPQHRGSRLLAQALATFSRLQKFNGKRLDLFFVTVANSFLGGTCKKQKFQLQLQVKKYENSPSN
jgi:hypothetical protein